MCVSRESSPKYIIRASDDECAAAAVRNSAMCDAGAYLDDLFLVGAEGPKH